MTSTAYTILLVDDDPIVRIGIGKELEADGYHVQTASSGESALATLDQAQEAFDLVITDLIMGTVGGLQVLKTSKQKNPDGMVMILTGYGELNSAIQAIRLGADDYMLKPGSPEERSFRIRELFVKAELKRKLKLYEKILPVCCVCKQIRDDSGRSPGQGAWMPVEKFLHTRGKIEITSSYCPDCYTKLMAELRITPADLK